LFNIIPENPNSDKVNLHQRIFHFFFWQAVGNYVCLF
jgi:hypothetical protein